MQLRHYARVILRWLWLILLGTLLCAGATFVVSKKTPPVYESSALIQVNDVGSTGNSGVFNNQAVAVNYALEVTGNDVLQEVSKELPGLTAADLATSVSASPLDNTSLIEVRADAHDAHQAADITNTVAMVFIQQQVAKESAINQSAAAKLSEELVTAKANVDKAQAQLTTLENAQAPQNQIAYQTDILDNYQVNYNTLFASYSQIQLQESLINSSLSIAQSAVPPTTATSPHILLNTVIAAALGLLLTVAFALLLDWLDSTIKTSEDVAQLALLEPLGSIPLRPRSWRHRSLAHDSAVKQAFVTISTSFKAMSNGKRAVLVTGLRTGSGVSLAASRLAIALTQSGRRVLLVDANLSQPMQHVMFNVLNTRGLTVGLDGIDTSSSQSTLPRGWLKQWVTSVPNLYLLPVGPQIDHAEPIQLAFRLQVLTERLLRQSSSSSLASLSSDEIDIIIFDAPALDQGPDTIALAPATDCTVLVVEAGKERPEALLRVQATLQRLGSPIVGVVVNRQQAKHRTYYYANHLQQVTVSAETSHIRAASKYPILQTRTNPLKAQPETPPPAHVQQLIGASFDGDTAPRATLSIPHIPGATKVNAPDKLDVMLDPPQTNGSWPSDDQGGQL